MPKGLHDDHRKRVRKEFLANGFNSDTPPHKIVEMMLFYSIPRVDTNETAHLLMDNFGSISKLIDARPEDIMKVKGAGENTAIFLKFIRFIANYYVNEKHSGTKRFNHIDEICSFLFDKYLGFKNEVIAITSLDNSGGYLGFDIIGEGDIASVGISARQVIEIVIKRNAAAIILSHNHPGGRAIPSNEDLQATAVIADALRRIDVVLLDHIIIVDDDYVSLKSSHQYRYIFEQSDT